MVAGGHLAHHVSDLVDDLDLTAFYAPYEGDGRHMWRLNSALASRPDRRDWSRWLIWWLDPVAIMTKDAYGCTQDSVR